MTGASRKGAVMRWRNEGVGVDCATETEGGGKSLLGVAACCTYHLYVIEALQARAWEYPK